MTEDQRQKANELHNQIQLYRDIQQKLMRNTDSLWYKGVCLMDLAHDANQYIGFRLYERIGKTIEEEIAYLLNNYEKQFNEL